MLFGSALRAGRRRARARHELAQQRFGFGMRLRRPARPELLAPPLRDVRSGAALRVLGGQVHLVRGERFHEAVPAPARRAVQGRLAAAIARVDVRAGCQQQLHRFDRLRFGLVAAARVEVRLSRCRPPPSAA